MNIALLKCLASAFTITSLSLGYCSAHASGRVDVGTDNTDTAERCAYLDEQAQNATFVVYFPQSNRRLVCNASRAGEPVLPASTFKIAHALIALETGAIADEHAAEAPDGRARAVPSWNQATSLASGMANSTVWFYQRLAERIGSENERYWLKKLNYGNEDMGSDAELATFWLTGALRISALEQVDFVDRLRRLDLPASPENQQRVAKMLITDRSSQNDPMSWVLHGKTGAVLPIGRNGDIATGPAAERMVEGLDPVGWYTGWVERSDADGGDAVFALHLPLASQDALAKRVPLTLEMLEINGVYMNRSD